MIYFLSILLDLAKNKRTSLQWNYLMEIKPKKNTLYTGHAWEDLNNLQMVILLGIWSH